MVGYDLTVITFQWVKASISNNPVVLAPATMHSFQELVPFWSIIGFILSA